jgi:hypothetical protein
MGTLIGYDSAPQPPWTYLGHEPRPSVRRANPGVRSTK